MNRLQEAGAIIGIGMLAMPAGLETMPIAVFQNDLDLVLWYAVAVAIVGLVGWSLPDDENNS